MNTKISEAAVEAAAMGVAGSRAEWFGYTPDVKDGLKEIQRAAITAAPPHLHPQPAELAEQQADARAQFEVWALKRGISLVRDQHYSGRQYYAYNDVELAFEAYQAALAAAQPGAQLAVWCGPMPESNGRQNWTVMLYRKGGEIFREGPIQIERSEYPDRVRYEADRLRYLIGEREDEPDIMKYDANLHSGYVEQPAQGIDLGQFRPAALAYWSECKGLQMNAVGGPFAQQNAAAEKVKEAERLLALIDQRDAAPGVGNG